MASTRREFLSRMSSLLSALVTAPAACRPRADPGGYAGYTRPNRNGDAFPLSTSVAGVAYSARGARRIHICPEEVRPPWVSSGKLPRGR